MPLDRLGLFDTPPVRGEMRIGVAIVAIQLLALLVIVPVANVQLGVLDGFVPLVDALMLVSELIIATMLYAQASVFRSRALALLASGYIFSSVLLVFHTITFPGVFAPRGLLASLSTTAWLVILRRFGFPVAVMLYVRLKAADAANPTNAERRSPSTFKWILGGLGLACLAVLLATVGEGLLPRLYVNLHDADFANLLIMHSATIVLTIVAMAFVLRSELSVLDVWLLVALAGWLIQATVNIPVHARYTVGFYSVFIIMLAASLTVMIALIAESNRLYSRLAIATSARERELDARMASMDAVAAAISQEVGQPLTGAALSASACLHWLTREEPDVPRAIQSLQDSIDSGRRTFEVIKSIRTAIADRPEGPCECSINDLVRQTAATMDRELAARKIAVRLTLDESLPSILIDKVQMRRVLITLLTHATYSVSSARGARLIDIRTAPLESDSIVVEVSHSGEITPDEMERLFEAGSAGAEFGLPVSRIIVERHGGKLWASTSDGDGATFHMRLPRQPASCSKKCDRKAALKFFSQLELELTSLVALIEREIAELGCGSADSAHRLHALRLKAETVAAAPTFAETNRSA